MRFRAASGLAGFRAARRRPAATPVNPARRKTATAVSRTAATTWADVPARSRWASSHIGDITDIMQHLNVPVPAGRGRDDRRRAATPEAAAGAAERGDGRAELPVMGVADGPLDQERLGGAGEQPSPPPPRTPAPPPPGAASRPCAAGRAGSPGSPAGSANHAGQRDHHRPGSCRRARRIRHAGKTTRLAGQNVIFGRIHAPAGASFSCLAATRRPLVIRPPRVQSG
jgi:hypothetical protein